jgi:hypothetical protein
LFHVVGKSISIHGFGVFLLEPKYIDAFMNFAPSKIACGEIKFAEDVTEGLQGAPQALLSVQDGTNTGKSVVVLAEA